MPIARVLGSQCNVRNVRMKGLRQGGKVSKWEVSPMIQLVSIRIINRPELPKPQYLFSAYAGPCTSSRWRR